MMHILIAEDEKELANSLKKSLAAEGYEVSIACDGEQTLDLLRARKYDALLLDWRMPKMSGLDVCKTLRSEGNDIPIILITALSDIANKIEALHHGADDYITKPFSFEEVLARITAVRRRYESHSDRIKFDGLELDLHKRMLHFSNGSLKLPEKEFELLTYFLDHQNTIINKETLAKDVWQLPFLPTTNFIEATVKNLRKKLEDISPAKFIKTVYGEGYIFVTE